MKEPNIGRNIWDLAVFCVGSAELLRLIYLHPRSGERISAGFLAAAFVGAVVLVAFWGAVVGYVGRWRNWPPVACVLVAYLPLAQGALCYFLSGHDRWREALLIFFLGLASGTVARRIAYPALTDLEAMAPEPPPTLFPK
jgi:hypothetical protein